MEPILVTGAAGKTGKAVVAALAARGAEVRALVHRNEQAAPLHALGAAEVVVGDQRHEDVLVGALQSAAAVYAIAPNMSPDEPTMMAALVAACRRAGVGRVVHHSVVHPHASAMPHHADKLAAEELLLEAGLAPTVLRPNAYFENLLGYRDDLSRGLYAVPYSVVSRFWMVALGDVADVAAEVLTEPGHEHAAYELSGPEGLTPADIARAVAAVLGREVVARPVAAEDWADERGLAGEARRRLLAMAAHYDRHGSPGNPNVLRWLLGREPTTFAAWATTNLTVDAPSAAGTG